MSTPDTGGDGENSLSGLELGEDVESPEEAKRRRAADVGVAEKMRGIGYDPDHDLGRAYARVLKQTGAGTLMVLNQRKQLHARARSWGITLPPSPPNWADEAYVLINESAAAAAPRFIRTGLPKWRPDGGASINTFFVRFTIMNDFKTRYSRFCRREGDVRANELCCDDDELLDRPGPNNQPDDLLVDQMLVREALRQMPPRVQQVAELVAADRPRREISETLGVSSKTIGRDLQWLAEQLRTEHGWTTGDGAS